MMRSNLYRNIFFLAWLVINLLQSWLTEIQPDEAYYYMYSRELAWGYFDHPPVIALLIKIGYSIFPSEFGLRLIPIFTGALSIFIMEKIVKPKDVGLFYIFLSTVAILHFIGFFSIPDSPLMLFTVLFFWLYRKFLEGPSLRWSVLLGLVGSLMMLSKYHAVLVIGFLILSNLKLLRNKYFWLTVLVFLVGISPHLNWQIVNEFPSVKYQLYGRAGDPYKFRYTSEYITTLPFILGPIVSIVMIIATIVLPSKDDFERGLKWCFWGVNIFFFFSTFSGWVEGHWILITLLPGLFFGYKLAEEKPRYQKVVRYQFIPVLVLILMARFIVAFDVLPAKGALKSLKKRYHGNKEWAAQIKSKVGDTPLVFLSTYKNPSIYTFYTGDQATSFNTVYSRQNQYSLWKYEEGLRGKTVAVIPNYNVGLEDSVHTLKGRVDLDYIDNYNPITNIWIEPADFPEQAHGGDTLLLSFELESLANIDLEANPDYATTLMYMFYDQSKEISVVRTGILVGNKDLNTTLKCPVLIPEYPGKIKFKIGLKSGWIAPGYHSNWQDIEIISSSNNRKE